MSSSDITKKDASLICCISSLGGLVITSLIAGSILYLVFGIKFLVEDFDLAKSCPESNLWVYVLVSMILSLSRGKALSKDDNGEFIICTIVIVIAIEIGLASWGGYQLYTLDSTHNLSTVNSTNELLTTSSTGCTDLRNSHLWSFGLGTFCLQVIAASMLSLVIIIPATLVCWASSDCCKKRASATRDLSIITNEP